jgi:hypothetical protein
VPDGTHPGISDEALLALPRYRQSDLFTEREKLALDYTAAVMRTPVQVTDNLFASMKEHFSDEQLVEITALLTLVNVDRFNAAFGIGSAGFSEGMVCVPPDRPATNPRAGEDRLTTSWRPAMLVSVWVSAYRVPALAGDAQDHDGHPEADEGIEDRCTRGDCESARDDRQRDICVDTGMIAVRDQCGTVQPVAGAAAYQRGEPVAGEPDCSRERECEQMAGRGWVNQAQDRLIRGNARGKEDRRHDRQAGQALGARGAHGERDPERDRGQGVPAVVDQVGQQRQAAAEREHDRLHRGRYAEDGERDRNGPNALARALDALIDETVPVPVLVGVPVAVLVFVRPGVWVGVAQGAVTVQIALDELIGGGRHGQVSIECACVVGLDR